MSDKKVVSFRLERDVLEKLDEIAVVERERLKVELEKVGLTVDKFSAKDCLALVIRRYHIQLIEDGYISDRDY